MTHPVIKKKQKRESLQLPFLCFINYLSIFDDESYLYSVVSNHNKFPEYCQQGLALRFCFIDAGSSSGTLTTYLIKPVSRDPLRSGITELI